MYDDFMYANNNILFMRAGGMGEKKNVYALI